MPYGIRSRRTRATRLIALADLLEFVEAQVGSQPGLERQLDALMTAISSERLTLTDPWTATREGLAWAGLPTVDPARIGVATVRHWATCARLAVVLERRGQVRVWGEPRLRAAERDAGAPIASAELGRTGDGRRRLRRPDLVLFPLGAGRALPAAIGVELSVKGSRRLEAIARARGQVPAR